MPSERPPGCNCLWPEVRYGTANEHARSCAIQRRETLQGAMDLVLDAWDQHRLNPCTETHQAAEIEEIHLRTLMAQGAESLKILTEES